MTNTESVSRSVEVSNVTTTMVIVTLLDLLNTEILLFLITMILFSINFRSALYSKTKFIFRSGQKLIFILLYNHVWLKTPLSYLLENMPEVNNSMLCLLHKRL